MEVYAPNLKDLASRDVCSRLDLPGGPGGTRGRGKDFVYLDIRAETINKYKTSPTGGTVDKRLGREAAPRHHRLRADLSRRRPDQGADADPADRPLRDGGSRPTSTARSFATLQAPWSPGSIRRARAPA